jgi:hypothetical protein
MFFEVNAAFDHLSRHWYYREDESEVVKAASGHIKRGCFDAFKIIVTETVDHYAQLCRVDTSLIDNGEFERKMHVAIAEIRRGAVLARQAEGDSRNVEAWHRAYELWEPVLLQCAEFDQAFFRNPKVEWAKKKTRYRTWRYRAEGLILAIVGGLLVWLLVYVLNVSLSL